MRDWELKSIVLAEFLGYNVTIVDDTSTSGVGLPDNPIGLVTMFRGSSGSSYALYNKDGKTTDNLFFDTSYDALMRVVFKIEKLGYNVNISRSGIQIWKRNEGSASELIIDEDKLDDYVGFEKFTALFTSLVSFVEWYNESQHEKN